MTTAEKQRLQEAFVRGYQQAYEDLTAEIDTAMLRGRVRVIGRQRAKEAIPDDEQ